jgi:hypothetical protein
VADEDGVADAGGADELGCRLAAGPALQATTRRIPNKAKRRVGNLVMGVQTRGVRFGSAGSSAAGRSLVRAATSSEANQVLVQLEPGAVVAVDAWRCDITLISGRGQL